MITVIRIYLLLVNSSNHSRARTHASKGKRSDRKFRIFSLKSKYLETWNKSCNVSEPKQRQRSEYTFAWSGSCAGLSQNFNIGQIKLSLSVKATNCLFFTTPYKETRGTFVPLNVMFVLKNLKGWNSTFEEDMPWKRPIKHMRAKTGDHKHAVRSCCHSRIALSPRTRNRRTFPANWQVDIYTFSTLH